MSCLSNISICRCLRNDLNFSNENILGFLLILERLKVEGKSFWTMVMWVRMGTLVRKIRKASFFITYSLKESKNKFKGKYNTLPLFFFLWISCSKCDISAENLYFTRRTSVYCWPFYFLHIFHFSIPHSLFLFFTWSRCKIKTALFYFSSSLKVFCKLNDQ